MITRFSRILVIICVMVAGSLCIAFGADSGDINYTEYTESIQRFSIKSKAVGVTYSISVGLPPRYDASGPPHVAIFLLDGNWLFNGFYSSYDKEDDHILIGINNSHRRDTDYLPVNTCNTAGGGNADFLAFLLSELVPYLDKKYNIDAKQRLLFGHSHGGSFVFYTLFADHGKTFPLLFSNDASLQCWNVSALERWYYYLNKRLPVIFYSSGATEGLAYAVLPIMNRIIRRNYVGLIVTYDQIQGTHNGILNRAISRGFSWISDQLSNR